MSRAESTDEDQLSGDGLAAALQKALEQIQATSIPVRSLIARDSLGDSGPDISASITASLMPVANRLRDLVVKDPRFPREDILRVREEAGIVAFYPNFIAFPLLHRLMETQSPSATIEWLQKVLRTPYADGKSITALWGVHVERSFLLVPEVRIVPIADLPNSRQKRLMTAPPMDSLIMSTLQFRPPTAAIVMECRIEPYIMRANVSESDGFEQFTKDWDLISEIVLSLTAVGPRVPIVAAHWFTFDDADLQAVGLSSGGRSQPLIELLPRYADYPALDEAEATKFVQAYLALPTAAKNKVRLALRRLGNALRRHDPGDGSVELSIALECLVGDGEPNEMTHKIRVRAARFIGGGKEEIKRNRDLIKETYRIRSKVVHGDNRWQGKPIDGHAMRAEEIVASTSDLCVTLIKKLVHRGEIPNWQEFDILGDVK